MALWAGHIFGYSRNERRVSNTADFGVFLYIIICIKQCEAVLGYVTLPNVMFDHAWNSDITSVLEVVATRSESIFKLY